MYDYLIGRVTSVKDGYLVLDNQGIGYRIEVPSPVLGQMVVGEEAKVFVYHQVSETDFNLYGFLDEFSRQVFLLLISVSGVGPKMGNKILSYKDARELIEAVALKDLQVIKGVKGLGEKTSQRLIVEIQKKAEELLLTQHDGWGGGVRREASSSENQQRIMLRENLRLALINLGYRETQILPLIDQAMSGDLEGVDDLGKEHKIGESDQDFEIILKAILQKVSLL